MAGETKVSSPLAWNPRCAKRDLQPYITTQWNTFDNLWNLTLGPASSNIGLFQDELQGRFTDGFLGIHASGHFAIGGDAGDVFSSPNDPVFWLHHAMLDRVWWIWQALQPKQAKTVSGGTVLGQPTSRATRLDDLIQLNCLNVEDVTLLEMMDSLSGEPLCYVYV